MRRKNDKTVKAKSFRVQLIIVVFLLLLGAVAFCPSVQTQQAACEQVWDEQGRSLIASGPFRLEIQGGERIYAVEAFGFVPPDLASKYSDFVKRQKASYEIWVSKGHNPGKAELALGGRLMRFDEFVEAGWKAHTAYRMTVSKTFVLALNPCVAKILENFRDQWITILIKLRPTT